MSIPQAITNEIEAFAGQVRGYLDGSVSPEQLKTCRLQVGIYGLRGIKDKQMIRVKLPSGRLTAEQLTYLADLAEECATGRGHVTTRQDLQFYEVPIQRTPEFLGRLERAGLTSREACGNSVRNVTACPLAGLCVEELFDVTPYALAVTNHFLRNPISQALPRKFKMSFSGCSHDCAMAPIHDIGAIATTSTTNGVISYGFRLYVGGGLGAIPMPAQLLEPFTPIDDLLPTCEAIIRVFDQHGERKNRQRARMKFLIERIGIEAFRQFVIEVRALLQAERHRFPPLPPVHPTVQEAINHLPFPQNGTGLYRRWLSTNVRRQPQAGLTVVTVRLLLGDMTAHQMRELATISRRYARGILITTQEQNICVPWVAEEYLPALYHALSSIHLASSEAQRIQDITSCPGAETCQIGITASRGLTRALMDVLEQPDYLSEDLKGVRIKISGCPNSCGQHHIADIGLHGAAKNVHGKPLPVYQLLVGGGLHDGSVRFGQPLVKLPARHVPEAITRLVQRYQRGHHEGESFRQFLQRVGPATLREGLEELADVRPPTEEPEAYRDWGQTADFSLGGMGQGECAG